MVREMGMAAVPLWFVATKDGAVSHGEGFPLPQSSGRVKQWLLNHGGVDWEVVSHHGAYRATFDSAEDAAQYLEHWCQQQRKALGEAYRAAQMLTVEMTPELKG